MYRRLQTIIGKNANAMLSAHGNLIFGMFVEQDHSNGKTKMPVAGSKSVFLVGKERVLDGVNSVRTNISDYDPLFENIAEGEMVVLESLQRGEVYAINQITMAGVVANDKLKVDVSGKLVKDATGTDAIAVYIGAYDDTGNSLHAIRIL